MTCAIIVTIGLAFNGFDSPAGKAISAILSGALLTMLLIDTKPSVDFWKKRLSVLIPAGLAAAWLILGGLGFQIVETPLPMPFAPDYFPATLLAWLGGMAALVSGSIVGRNQARMTHVLRLIALFIATTLAVGLVMYSIELPSGIFDYWTIARRGRFAGLVGNVNVTAALAGSVALLALALAAESGQRLRHFATSIAFVAIALIALTALLLTAARFPTTICILLLFALTVIIIIRTRTHARLKRLFWICLILLGVSMIVANSYAEWVIGRFGTVQVDANIRTLMWDHYLQLALESPIQGYGMGAFSTLNTHRLDTPELAATLWFVNSPHNLPLQITLEGGLPYLLLLIIAALFLLRSLFLMSRTEPMSIEMMGVSTMILQILICALVDIPMDVPAMITLTLFLAGLLWGRALSPGRRRRSHRVPANHHRAIHGGSPNDIEQPHPRSAI